MDQSNFNLHVIHMHLIFFFSLGKDAFYLSPDIRKQCDWFQADQPAKNLVQFGYKQM